MRISQAPLTTPPIEGSPLKFSLAWRNFHQMAGDCLTAQNAIKGDADLQWSVHGNLVRIQVSASSSPRGLSLPQIPRGDQFVFGNGPTGLVALPIADGVPTISVPADTVAWGDYFYKEATNA